MLRSAYTFDDVALVPQFNNIASRTEPDKYLQRFFERAPQLVSHHFQYRKVDTEMRSRDLSVALEHRPYPTDLRYTGGRSTIAS